MEKTKKEKVTISLNSEILILAKKQAIDERTSLSAMIEKLLTKYISTNHKEKSTNC